MNKKIFFCISLTLLTILGISAQCSSDRRADVQRVRDGVRNGELNRREVKEIRKEARKVEMAKRRAEADGKITRREARKIAKMERQLDRKIYNEKHDCQKACKR